MMKSETVTADGVVVSVVIDDKGAVTSWATRDGVPCDLPSGFPLPVVDIGEAPADGE